MKTAGLAALLVAALAASAVAAGEPAPAKEAAGMEVRTYGSSQDPALRLSAEFHVPAEARPLCLCFHGWHQSAAVSRTGEPFVVPLARQAFSQAAASVPVREVVLRLSGDVAELALDEKGGPRKVERWRQSGSWSDFKWKSDGSWTARVPGRPADRPRPSR